MKTLREWRAERMIGVKDLAARTGVSNKTIVDIEHGRRLPRWQTMRKLCEALGVQPHEVTEFVAARQELLGEHAAA